MKYNEIDFDTYYRNYPNESGYFGRYGGAYLPDELRDAMQEIADA